VGIGDELKERDEEQDKGIFRDSSGKIDIEEDATEELRGEELEDKEYRKVIEHKQQRGPSI